jgi:hypothetical protein
MLLNRASYRDHLKNILGFGAPDNQLNAWIDQALSCYMSRAPRKLSGQLIGVAGDSFITCPVDWLIGSSNNDTILQNISQHNGAYPDQPLVSATPFNFNNRWQGGNFGFRGGNFAGYGYIGSSSSFRASNMNTLAMPLAPPPNQLPSYQVTVETVGINVIKKIHLKENLTQDFAADILYDGEHFISETSSTIPQNHEQIIIDIANIYFRARNADKGIGRGATTDITAQINLILSRIAPLSSGRI